MKKSWSGVYFSRPDNLKFLYLCVQGYKKKKEKRGGVSICTFLILCCVTPVQTISDKKKKRNLRETRGIGLEARLPCPVRLFQSSIVSNVFGQCQLSINVVILAVWSLDRKVPVLVHEALRFFVKCLFCLVCPPLQERKKRGGGSEKMLQLHENRGWVERRVFFFAYVLNSAGIVIVPSYIVKPMLCK